MTTPCDWIESRPEQLLSEDPEVRRQVDTHARTCPACSEQLGAYREVDRLLASCYSARLARAQAQNAMPRALVAAAALAAVLLVVWIGFGTPLPGVPSGNPDIASTSGEAIGNGEDALAKPSEDESTAREAAGSFDTAAPADPALYVVDAAGYFHTLADFNGSVVILGVFDATGAGGPAFGELYDAIPSRADLQFLAVGPGELPADAVGGAPMMVNSGSALLGIQTGEFAILTREGEVYRRGDLSSPIAGTLQDVQASLEELGFPVQ